MITVEPARPEDYPALVATSVAAFHDDVNHGAPAGPLGGPPGYDSVAWHRAVSGWGSLFRLVEAGKIVGGAIAWSKGDGTGGIGRIWLVPAAQGRGLGAAAMAKVEARFPDVVRWTLDTPLWNARNRHFYASTCGYREVSTDGEFAYFEKTLPT